MMDLNSALIACIDVKRGVARLRMRGEVCSNPTVAIGVVYLLPRWLLVGQLQLEGAPDGRRQGRQHLAAQQQPPRALQARHPLVVASRGG